MRCSLFIFSVSLLFTGACRKSSIPPIKLPQKYAALNGAWTGIGSKTQSYSRVPPDLFFQFEITYLNDLALLVGRDSLFYDEKESTPDVAYFSEEMQTQNTYNGSYIQYDLRTGNITYGYSASNKYVRLHSYVSTDGYRPNRLLPSYIPHLTGEKLLHGSVHDADSSGFSKYDTTYEIARVIRFSAVNDSTLTLDNTVLAFGDPTLHYKSTDAADGTITFETFHRDLTQIATLIYYYNTDNIVYKEWDGDLGRDFKVELR